MNTQTIARQLPMPGIRFSLGTRRSRTLCLVIFCLTIFVGLFLWAWLVGENGLAVNFTQRNQPPSWDHPFGTDWLGRDMLVRTIKGLRISLGIGMAAALSSTVFALALGLAAATLGRHMDLVVTGMIDVVISTPHLVMLILISFSMGGGVVGIIMAVALSHWTRLARIVRAEIMQLKTADYVRLSRRLGRSPLWIARHHLLPNLLPQFLVGLILLFPHAIMHAAGLTFLGFGLPPHMPAIGVLLSEAMRHISTGYWWLAVVPGVALLFFVKLFDLLGRALRMLTAPKTSKE
ncbi:peptide ABC transporter, permease protein [Desulfosarcina variabilis str. Montpellier]|uniref:ABC transporter permease n=1 Tax=Desulfosarcina variabilis TaxID=2300 RepID=UPI003AFA5FDF